MAPPPASIQVTLKQKQLLAKLGATPADHLKAAQRHHLNQQLDKLKTRLTTLVHIRVLAELGNITISSRAERISQPRPTNLYQTLRLEETSQLDDKILNG